MGHKGRAGMIIAVVAASLLPWGAAAELDLTPVPVVPVDREAPVTLDFPTDPAADPAAEADDAPPVALPSDLNDVDAAAEAEEPAETPESESDEPATRRERREAWAVYCFQDNQEVLTVAPLYRVLRMRNGLQDWYYETADGVLFAGRIGTNVNCYFEPLDAGAARVASLPSSFPEIEEPPAEERTSPLLDIGFGDPGTVDDSAADAEPPPRPAWTQPSSAPRPPASRARPADADTGHWVQLAALPSRQSARAEWRLISRRLGPDLTRYQPAIRPVAPSAGESDLYGLRIFPSNRVAAVRTCAVLEARGQACRLPRATDTSTAPALAEVAPALSQGLLPMTDIPSTVGFEAMLVAEAPAGLGTVAPAIADATAPPKIATEIARAEADIGGLSPSEGVPPLAEISLREEQLMPDPMADVALNFSQLEPQAVDGPANSADNQGLDGIQMVADLQPRPWGAPSLALERELFGSVDLIATRVRASGSLAAALHPGPPAILQLAVYEREADAQRAWDVLSEAHPRLLGGHRPAIEHTVPEFGPPHYRVQVTMPSLSMADAVCRQLNDAGDDCWVVR